MELAAELSNWPWKNSGYDKACQAIRADYDSRRATWKRTQMLEDLVALAAAIASDRNCDLVLWNKASKVKERLKVIARDFGVPNMPLHKD